MKKVLQVICEPFENGGQELLICNLYRNIDKTRIIFDFITPYNGLNDKIVDELKNYGSKFIGVPINQKKGGLKQRILFFKELDKFLKKNKYEIIHINSVSILGLMLGTIVAHKYKIKNIIVHSHNDGVNTFKYKIIKFISKPFLNNYPTLYLGCSTNALNWKFSKKVIENKKKLVLKNGIDTKKFKYNEDVRNEYRKILGLNDYFVIGHVGRFEEQKNHEFLIEIFNEFHKTNKDSKLVLVGEGSLVEKIIKKINDFGLSDDVIYLGVRNDVEKIMQAFDAFVFPSIFEGLGLAVIEAETSGVSVVCSDRLPKEVDLTDNIYKLSLDNKESWIKCLNLLKNSNEKDRKKYSKIIEEKGYNIKSVSESLLEIYLGLEGE